MRKLSSTEKKVGGDKERDTKTENGSFTHMNGGVKCT